MTRRICSKTYSQPVSHFNRRSKLQPPVSLRARTLLRVLAFKEKRSTSLQADLNESGSSRLDCSAKQNDSNFSSRYAKAFALRSNSYICDSFNIGAATSGISSPFLLRQLTCRIQNRDPSRASSGFVLSHSSCTILQVDFFKTSTLYLSS